MNSTFQYGHHYTQATNQVSARVPAAKGSYVFHRPDNLFGSVVTYSRLNHRADAIPERVTESFEELAIRCAKPTISDKKGGASFSPFTFSLTPYDGYQPQECNFLAFKFEKLWAFTEPDDIFECVNGLASFVYSSRSHTISPRQTGSYQLIVALRTPMPVECVKPVAMNFATRFCQIPGIINSSYMSPDQRIDYPSCSAGRQRHFMSDVQFGRSYDWLADSVSLQTPTFPQVGSMQ